MQINNNNYSVLELIQMLERKELIVNKDYQRGSGLWPISARAFFIDTILQGFPFPKIYMYEYLDRPARGMKKEIVDGQQRISSIVGFYNNEFPLQAEGANKGKRFQDLDEEEQEKFLSYSASVDVIRNATKADILQMFRRMNAYTMPLNDAEKRHSSFHGDFKWFVNELADELNEFFVEFNVFTTKQITRMSDAALISDWVLAYERGVISTNASDLKSLYERYDQNFVQSADYHRVIVETVRFISENFGELRGSHMMKPYALHSLFTALAHNRFGIRPISDEWHVTPSGTFCHDAGESLRSLLEMAAAHEGKETDGPHARYVWGCSSTTDRRPRRTARVAAIMRALALDVPDAVDGNLT
ncbi:DUF262 domain-containing protein [Maliponia aquimaris]|uniref:GmrSD restriction endonucleases N-terminal domain-containing protein n=1 Tax=Maliponia aquimaris TaxID=1673631 RepID=A0A238K433_9RHOB|nr:DUF262 domain-containing protein [Maliponia aquimaris]SMX37649.1 hypothetical protein MAA8898_01215 [Maliponia aquimaris]